MVMFTASMVVTMGLLAGSGRLSRRFESTTCPVAAEEASSSGASAVTVTVSAWVPTWSAMLTLRVSPTRSSSGPCWKFLKPGHFGHQAVLPGNQVLQVEDSFRRAPGRSLHVGLNVDGLDGPAGHYCARGVGEAARDAAGGYLGAAGSWRRAKGQPAV